MSGLNLFEQLVWKPFQAIGLSHSFFHVNAHTVTSTWVALGALLIMALIGRYYISKPYTIGGYASRALVQSFVSMTEQSLGTFNYAYFAFITSIFLFIIGCNWVGLIPLIEEPTKDLNTTLALGVITFLYIQRAAISKHGVKSYIKDYFSPIFIMFPLNVLGEVATIISLSFRLFGNIFGGSIIMGIFNQAIAGSWIGNILTTVTGINIAIMTFFILFEGFLQAFVFSILSMTNLAMAIYEEEGEHLA
jgi:F-type H+-transporting ATPase subunit a